MYPAETLIAQRYEILECLRAGARGTVYRVFDTQGEGELALKFPPDGHGLDPAYRETFEQEAALLQRLQIHAVIGCRGLGRHGDLMPFIILESLKGRGLTDYLKAGEAQGGRLKKKRILSMLRPLGAAMHAAHQEQVALRAFHPDNILVRKGIKGPRAMCLVDLSLAAPFGKELVGQWPNAPHYVPPEGWSKKPLATHPLGDVYAFGMLVYRVLATRHPCPSDEPEEVARFCRGETPPSLHAFRDDLPDLMDEWVKRALAPRPSERFGSVAELWSALESLLFPRSDWVTALLASGTSAPFAPYLPR